MRIGDLLALSTFQGTTLVAGVAGREREVTWAHVVDVPEPAAWVGEGQLLLTTGYAWPHETNAEREQIEALAARGLAGIGLAVPGYAEHFSQGAKNAADRLALPLLEIPWDVPFARITEELHRAILTSQQNLIARSEAIHRALTRAAGEGTTLADLARHLSDSLKRAAAIEDPHGQLLGYHDPGAAVGSTKPELALHELERAGLLAQLRQSAVPVAVPAFPELRTTRRLVCPIRAGGALAGFVWLGEGSVPFSELDRRAIEHASLVAALHISHQRELAQVETRLGYASFLSLLEAPATTPQTLERAQLLGFDPKLVYRAGIVLLDEALPLGRDAVMRRDAIVERLRAHLVASGEVRPKLGVWLNRIPFLVPDDIDLEGIAAALLPDPVRLVVGRPAAGTDGVRASYGEAQQLLGYDGLARLARFEDVLVPRVLLGDAAARDGFLDELFRPLEGHKGQAAMREALLCYAEHGFAFRRTAAALGVHPNTLRYRLERASLLTGLALGEPDTRFRLQLAARLLPLLASHSDGRTKNKVRN
ncbi:MAG: PucR family transcriptional regulator ligand-binding domain-containing protein [Candidatus Eremiobacteraeota bacterium]|nr:PucR family transcriptional regulator ligand-binding domain-containing protein [Candidatus Eremiobacteraeota bacterium]